MRIHLVILLHFHLAFAGGSVKKWWSYAGKSGPSHWSGMCAGGKRQSPIDIADSEHSQRLLPLTFHYYDTLLEDMSVVNNGHSVKVCPADNSNVTAGISAGGLGGFYRFAQLHFHWGRHSDRGSEHRINGQAFPMEAHLVHYNSK